MSISMYTMLVYIVLLCYIVFNTMLFCLYYYFICGISRARAKYVFFHNIIHTRARALYGLFALFVQPLCLVVLWPIKRRIRGKIEVRMQYNKHSVALKSFSSSTEPLFFKKWDGGRPG